MKIPSRRGRRFVSAPTGKEKFASARRSRAFDGSILGGRQKNKKLGGRGVVNGDSLRSRENKVSTA